MAFIISPMCFPWAKNSSCSSSAGGATININVIRLSRHINDFIRPITGQSFFTNDISIFRFEEIVKINLISTVEDRKDCLLLSLIKHLVNDLSQCLCDTHINLFSHHHYTYSNTRNRVCQLKNALFLKKISLPQGQVRLDIFRVQPP